MQSLTRPHPLAWKKRGPLLPVKQPPVLEPGQSLCAECVPKTAACPSGFRFFTFPSKPVQDALSAFMLKFPREIRSMIYEHLSSMFKAYSGAFVTSDLPPGPGDVYMFDTGAWYSIRHFRGERIGTNSILELEAAPWPHQNIPHLFNRTPARHLKCLDPQLLNEMVDDMCLRAGHVRLSMQYRDHANPHRYDDRLFNRFASYARDLTITVAYHNIFSRRLPHHKATSLGYNYEPAIETLAVLDDLTRVFRDGGCRALTLTLNLNFDVPFTKDCRLTVNEAWVRDLVDTKLTHFGCNINLGIYNRCDDRYQVARDDYDCPSWEHIFSHHTAFNAKVGCWSPFSKRPMSVYEAAALECH